MAVDIIVNDDQVDVTATEEQVTNSVIPSTLVIKGEDGKDGMSPVVSISAINGGHRIYITDAEGTKSIDVMDGKNGSNGQDGNGIKSAVLNADYTLTLTFDNGETYTTPSIRGATGSSGKDGYDGKSAYEYAKEAGYTGTETEFAEKMASGGGSGGGSGTPGKSAYEYAQDGGYTGTEEEFARKMAEELPFGSELAIGTVLEETSPTFVEDAGAFVLFDPISVITGEQYTVNWNGTEYTCTCLEFDDTGNGDMVKTLGNSVAIGSDDTGEPFFIMCVPDSLSGEIPYAVMIAPIDGSAEVTISITGMVETVTPIPTKYLPELRGQKKILLNIDGQLCDLPFEALFAMDVNELQTSMRIIYNALEYSVSFVQKIDKYVSGVGQLQGLQFYFAGTNMEDVSKDIVFGYNWSNQDSGVPGVVQQWYLVPHTGEAWHVLTSGGGGPSWSSTKSIPFNEVKLINSENDTRYLRVDSQNRLTLSQYNWGERVVATFSGDDALTADRVISALGYTPADANAVPNIDTDAIVQEVIEAIGTPVFGRVDEENNIILSGELVSGTYNLKYENADGSTTNIGTLSVSEASKYTNLANPSDSMWETNKRINSSGSTVAIDSTKLGDQTCVITNIVDVSNVEKLHIKGLDIVNKLASGENYGRVYFYGASDNYIFYAQPSIETWQTVADYDSGVLVIDVDAAIADSGKSGITKMRLGGILTGAASDVIITADEQIV